MTSLKPAAGELIRAIESCDFYGAKRWLEQGSDPNERNAQGTPALLYAASRSLELVKLLVDSGADINARNAIGVPSILACIASGTMNPHHADILRFFIAKGVDLNIGDNGGRTPLHWAINIGNQQAEKIIRSALRKQKKHTVIKLRAERAERSKRERLSDIHNTAVARQNSLKNRSHPGIIIKP